MISALSKLKWFPDNNFKETQVVQFCFEIIETIVDRENASN